MYAPENRSVVDAYLRGYRAAYDDGHEFIIEMDAGMSHDPKALPIFIDALENNNLCAFGSRFISGGSMGDSPWNRRLLSKIGTILSNLLLGTRLKDMTSGYQGFHRSVVEKMLQFPIKSTAHFYQTELRYLLRNFAQVEIPIRYRAPSPRVSQKAIKNAIDTLLYYFRKRISGNSIAIN